MYDIARRELSPEFLQAWSAAGRHLQAVGHGGVMWLRATTQQPMVEHLSFRLGNQLFFVVVEVEGVSEYATVSERLIKDVAKAANAHCCALPLQKRGDDFRPMAPGWGLVDFESARPIDPPALVTDEPIVMTDWEVHDCGTDVVYRHLQKQGMTSVSRQPYPEIDPSIWFDGPRGREFVVVRAVRYPVRDARPPADADDIRAACASKSKLGNFASVSLANADDPFYPDGSGAKPLLRGHAFTPRFTGLVPL
jgi:hypothetical protein